MKLSKNKTFLKEGGGTRKVGHLGPAYPSGNCGTDGRRQEAENGLAPLR